MQSTSYIPIYYHTRDPNVCASGFSWNLFDSNVNYGEERGYKIPMPLHNMEQRLCHDKEVLKQVIENHEATFRYQVRELHRLYRRQRDLMGEMRVREKFAENLLSEASESIRSLFYVPFGFSQSPSHATSWPLEDFSCSIQRPANLITENSQQQMTILSDTSIRKNNYKENGSRIVDLEIPADMYHDDQGKQYMGENFLKVPEKHHKFQPASDSGSVKTGDLSRFDSYSRKIDLNEPVELESLPPGSSGPLETCHKEIMCNDRCISIKAVRESVVPKHTRLLNNGGSSVAIDLNSTPVSYFSETEITLQNLRSTNGETTSRSACNHATREKCAKDHLVVLNNLCDNLLVAHNKVTNRFLKTETNIDLNTGEVGEYSLPLSRSILQTKSAEDTELEGPVSPENVECSAPRGKSEDVQLETYLLPVQEGEPFVKLEIIAAQTLIMISSCGFREYMSTAMAEPLVNLGNCLRWFADIVSSTGDDLENKIMKLESYALDNDKGQVPSLKLKSEENSLNLFHVKKERETGILSTRSGNGRTRGRKQRMDFQTEVLRSLSIQRFPGTGLLRRKAGKKVCAKPIKFYKLSPSDVVTKSISSILRQPATLGKQGILESWGMIRKRQGGRRRRASISSY